MRSYLLVFLLMVSTFGISQIYVQSISNDSVSLWQTDKFFVYDYIIKNTNHDVLINILDQTSNCDSVTIKYSLNEVFIDEKAKLPLGNTNLKVWVRANKPFTQFPLVFSMVSDTVIFSDTLNITLNAKEGEYLFQHQVTDWIDFYSDRYEKIELQLYDHLWNLVSTIDTNSDRIMVRNLESGRYFIKTGDQVIAFDKINPQTYFSEPYVHHSTNQ